MSGFFGTPVDQAAWSTYTPTITSQGGTPTTVTATGRYKVIGKTAIVEINVTVTNAGTATGNMNATLPLTAASYNYSGSSFEYSATAKSGGAAINTGDLTRVFCRDAAAGSYWVTGYGVAISMIYELP